MQFSVKVGFLLLKSLSLLLNLILPFYIYLDLPVGNWHMIPPQKGQYEWGNRVT